MGTSGKIKTVDWIGFKKTTGKVVASRANNLVGRFSSNLVNYSADSGYSLTGKGKAVLGIGGAIYAARDAVTALETSRMGVNDGQITVATPAPELNREPSYQDNASATGDLVFALNKLRRG